MSEPEKHYDIKLEIGGGVGFRIRRRGSPGVTPNELGEGASQDIGGAMCAIGQMLATDAGEPRERTFTDCFSAVERALVVYALGRVARLGDRDVHKSALHKLGVDLEIDIPPYPLPAGQPGSEGLCSKTRCHRDAIYVQNGAPVCSEHYEGTPPQ